MNASVHTFHPVRRDMSASLAASRPFATSPVTTEMSAGDLAVLIARIRAEKVPTPEVLQPWLEHPDERVLGEMLRHRRIVKALSAEQRDNLVLRALTSADLRGVLWTPLLDEISCAYFAYVVRSPGIERPIAILLERARPLEAWLSVSASRDDVLALTTFRSPQIRTMIVMGATCLDAVLAEPFLASDFSCWLMLRNASVPQEVLDAILEHTFLRLLTHQRWQRDMSCQLDNLCALSKERATYPSTRMLREIIAWRADLCPPPGSRPLGMLDELVVATGEHHACSGSLDADTIAKLLQYPSEPLKLLTLGWLADMSAPV